MQIVSSKKAVAIFGSQSKNRTQQFHSIHDMMAIKVTRGVAALPPRYKLVLIFLVFVTGIFFFAPKREAIALPFDDKVAMQTKEGVLNESKAQPVSAANVVSSLKETKIEKTAKIVTCPRCRLNSLPLVKKFVYEHAPLYKHGLKVDFILGEDPVLYLFEDGKEVSKLALEVRYCNYAKTVLSDSTVEM